MTPERLESMKATAQSWGHDNPFREQLLTRLAAMGGLHAPSRTEDRLTRREQPRVDHARDVAEAKSEPCNAF